MAVVPGTPPRSHTFKFETSCVAFTIDTINPQFRGVPDQPFSLERPARVPQPARAGLHPSWLRAHQGMLQRRAWLQY